MVYTEGVQNKSKSENIKFDGKKAMETVKKEKQKEEIYRENSEKYWKKQKLVNEWTENKKKELTQEEKADIVKKVFTTYSYVGTLTGEQRRNAIIQYSNIFIRYIYKCPYVDYTTPFWSGFQFKSVNDMTEEELKLIFNQ